MKTPEAQSTALPDVAIKQDRRFDQPIDWVGMGAVQVPVKVNLQGQDLNLMAQIQVMVSLDLSPSRGIHMSRLYALVQDLGSVPLTMSALRELSVRLFESQNKQSLLSSASRLQLSFELPLRRQSLKSGLWSWKTYPLSLLLESRQGESALNLVDLRFMYSSTCPASAALARDLNSKNFLAHQNAPVLNPEVAAEFLNSEAGMIATPHAQRSEAHVQLLVDDSFELSQIPLWIDELESAVGTPVQGAVKREDEQEFARLNGTNLMFCEDAVRQLATTVDQLAGVTGYRLQMSHFESLHAHNAVSIKKKNFNFSV